MRPESPPSSHETESASEAEAYPVWKRWGDLDASKKSKATPASEAPQSRPEMPADGSPSWGPITKHDGRSASPGREDGSSGDRSDANSIDHQAAIESIIARTRGTGVGTSPQTDPESADSTGYDEGSPTGGKNGTVGRKNGTVGSEGVDGRADITPAGRSPGEDALPHDDRRSWDDDFSALDIRDRVVIMLLFKQVVQIEEVEAAWRRFQGTKQGRTRQPLWRILARDPAFDRERILAEAAKTSGFEPAHVDPKKAVAFMKAHASSFAEAEWERMVSLRVVPIGREKDLKSGRERFVFVAPDPTRPGVSKLLRDLNVGSNVLRYVPESTMEGLLDLLTGRSPSEASGNGGSLDGTSNGTSPGDSSPSDAARSESARSESARSESARSESARSESARSESARSESARNESEESDDAVPTPDVHAIANDEQSGRAGEAQPAGTGSLPHSEADVASNARPGEAPPTSTDESSSVESEEEPWARSEEPPPARSEEPPPARSEEPPPAQSEAASPAQSEAAPPARSGELRPDQKVAPQPEQAAENTTFTSPEDAAPAPPRSEASNLFEECLFEAVEKHASGVHLLPVDDGVQIDMRIGGALERWRTCPRPFGDDLLAVVKESALNIRPTEIDAVQDGLITREFGGELVRFSVSVLPIAGGWADDRRESVVISMLGDEPTSLNLDELGLPDEVLRHLRDAIVEPRGMVILAGPSGSGRSTTLSAILNEIVTPKVNVITLEDSVSHEAQGVRQVRLSHKLDHEDALEAVRRHDPDVILVGELRTKETAELALKLANAGHLVFSRVPAHDATAVVGRLFRLDVDPFLIAYAVNLIVAQRVVRRLCKECKQPAKHVDGELLRRIGFSRQEIASTTFYDEGDAAECTVCRGRRYHGTQIIAESMPFSHDVRRLIALADRSFDEEDARAHAVREGMTTIRTAARTVVLSGETSVDEMIRTTAGGN